MSTTTSTPTKKPSSKKFQRTIGVYAKTEISKESQQKLNSPLATADSKLSKEDNDFLENLMTRIKSGDIKLLDGNSIINQKVYDRLNAKQQAKVDQFIQTSLFVLRQIANYYPTAHSNDSFYMQNMLKELRLKKETLEKEMGDVLKI